MHDLWSQVEIFFPHLPSIFQTGFSSICDKVVNSKPKAAGSAIPKNCIWLNYYFYKLINLLSVFRAVLSVTDAVNLYWTNNLHQIEIPSSVPLALIPNTVHNVMVVVKVSNWIPRKWNISQKSGTKSASNVWFAKNR